MIDALRVLAFVVIVRPLVCGVLGLSRQGREWLPERGPAVVVANHNSHLDTLVVMCLFRLARLCDVRPVGARDYFTKSRWLEWLATRLLGVIPLERSCRPSGGDPLAACDRALADGQVLIVFPEGTRGEPEKIAPFRPGVAHLARRHPEVPFVPVWLEGCGKAMPRGSRIPIPFVCDVRIGEPTQWTGDRDAFIAELERRVIALRPHRSLRPRL